MTNATWCRKFGVVQMSFQPFTDGSQFRILAWPEATGVLKKQASVTLDCYK
jgi:hypothetical protein